METSRRGFLGLLAGAALGKVLGPRVIPAPTAAKWEAAIAAPPAPVVETYRTLELAAAEFLRIVDLETRWLRLERQRSPSELRIGNELLYHPYEPMTFVDLAGSLVSSPLSRVLVNEHSNSDWPLRDPMRLRDRPWDQLSKQYIEPAALSMGESIARSVKRRGGAEIMVSGKLQLPLDVNRAILVSNAEENLHVRALQYYQPPNPYTVHEGMHVRFDMLYGLA